MTTIDGRLKGVDGADDFEALACNPADPVPLAYRDAEKRFDEKVDILMSAIDLLDEQAEALSRRCDAFVEGQQQRKICEP